MDTNFDLFSMPEANDARANRIGKLADNQIQIKVNLRSSDYYVRVNGAIAAAIEKKALKFCTPVLNNLTGEVYLVFEESGKFPISNNGGSSMNYVFSRQLCEFLIVQAAKRRVETTNEVWTVSGDVSINIHRVVVRVEKCFA